MESEKLEADSGMSGDAVERAELFWAQLPVNRKWTALATHEKAMVCHLLARAALTPPVDGGQKLEAAWLIEETASGLIHWIALAVDEWPRTKTTTRRARMSADFDAETTAWRNPVVRVRDAGEAIRFARREDAEAFIKLFSRFLIHPVATEHAWPTPPVDGGEFVMVPREATEAMLDAAGLVDIEIYPTNVPSGLTATNRREARAIWKEMLAASPSRPSPSPEQREVVARRLHDRFIERSKARVTYDPDDAGCYANTPWERLPMSFKRDYYADAEAVLSALCDRGE